MSDQGRDWAIVCLVIDIYELALGLGELSEKWEDSVFFSFGLENLDVHQQNLRCGLIFKSALFWNSCIKKMCTPSHANQASCEMGLNIAVLILMIK